MILDRAKQPSSRLSLPQLRCAPEVVRLPPSSMKNLQAKRKTRNQEVLPLNVSCPETNSPTMMMMKMITYFARLRLSFFFRFSFCFHLYLFSSRLWTMMMMKRRASSSPSETTLLFFSSYYVAFQSERIINSSS